MKLNTGAYISMLVYKLTGLSGKKENLSNNI